ncbi:Protein of uncharacterised function (DUF3486) [Kingella kingae]|nr:Phage protein (modular protein) [Kingella kingae]STR03962.1 Protein of uncharacterised function (DUF3486) [Kingella kingae]
MNEKYRREGMRWHIINTLNKARPYTSSEVFLLDVMRGIYPNVTALELRQQLEYLQDRKLLDLTKQPSGMWFADLTVWVWILPNTRLSVRLALPDLKNTGRADMAPRSNMETLPENVRREFERCLIENGFANYTDLAAWLNQQGYQISRSAAYRYGSKIERRLRAIKESTEAAKLIVANADDENDSRSEALMALLQNQLFEALVDISEKDSEELAPEARFDLLSEGGKRIAGLISASTRLKEYQNKVKSRALAAADEVAKAVKKGGLSDDTAEQIRKQILGIAT